MITKSELDKLVEKYETTDFIKDDPIQFPHLAKTKEDKELYGFIASLFAYGNRKMFINTLKNIFSKSEGDLSGFIKNGDFSSLKGIEYRFSKENDIIPIFEILSALCNESKGLGELFEYACKNSPLIENGFKSEPKHDIYALLQTVVDYFYARAPKTVGHGFYHMIPNPRSGGAMKRMNMLLRWFVRDSVVDLGIWKFMKPSELLIPLDVHVSRVSRQMELLKRKSNDFKAVSELTENLRKFCPSDPIKYDFAIFAYGIEMNKKTEKKYGTL